MRILKIESLPDSKNWIDRCDIMLHACFQLLKDCIGKEHVDTDGDYEAQKEFVDELRFLYNWWLVRSKDVNFDNDEEDNRMLQRLIKIRTGLWT